MGYLMIKVSGDYGRLAHNFTEPETPTIARQWAATTPDHQPA